MLRFVTQRLIYIASICILIIFAIFLGMGMSRNSVYRVPNFEMGSHAVRAWTNTQVYLKDLVRLDLGSISHDLLGTISIQDLLLDTYFKSMGLLLTALCVSTILGVIFGISAALIKAKQAVTGFMLLSILGISTPSFFAGVLLHQAELKYLDVFGRPLVKMAGFGWDFQHMLLPVLVLMAYPLAYVTRAAYIALNNVLKERYIQTAHSKGLNKKTVLNVHALRNIAVPVLTAIGVSFRFSLSTLPVVEYFFAWPGLGLRLLEAIQDHQGRLVVTFALSLSLTIQLINLSLDVLYRIIDPRLRNDNEMA
jgi:peptide/nickel transport system permease protein